MKIPARNNIGLSLGSSLGDKLGFMRSARDSIARLPGVIRIRQSALYQTEPIDVRPEHMRNTYLNAALVLHGQMDLLEIWKGCRTIENTLGRVRADNRYAPRTMDIDMLFADDLTLNTPELRIPHPRWRERRFVVAPLAELIPDNPLPGDNRTVSEILASLPDIPEVIAFMGDW